MKPPELINLEDSGFLVKTARFLVARLERLSADSFWAHRASGLRGSLLRSLESVEEPGNANPAEMAARMQILRAHVNQAYTILANAAREIRVPDQK